MQRLYVLYYAEQTSRIDSENTDNKFQEALNDVSGIWSLEPGYDLAYQPSYYAKIDDIMVPEIAEEGVVALEAVERGNTLDKDLYYPVYSIHSALSSLVETTSPTR